MWSAAACRGSTELAEVRFGPVGLLAGPPAGPRPGYSERQQAAAVHIKTGFRSSPRTDAGSAASRTGCQPVLHAEAQMSFFHRRHLPHWQPDGQVFFITFRLFGSLPKAVVERLRSEARRLKAQPPNPRESPRERALRESQRLFALADEALADQLRSTTSSSTRWLAQRDVATVVQEAIHRRDGNVYRLHRYVVMPNHVHILIEPLSKVGQVVNSPYGESHPESPKTDVGQVVNLSYHSLSSILHSLKRHTAHKANQLLARQGSFWQEESYDHWVRDPADHARIIEYIDQNPCEAGLCRMPADWPLSSAGVVGQVDNLSYIKGDDSIPS